MEWRRAEKAEREKWLRNAMLGKHKSKNMNEFQLGEVIFDGSRRIKWEANKNMVVKAVETGDRIHSHLYIWEGSYNLKQLNFDEWGNWKCDPKRGKTKTYSRFIFNTRLDGKETNSAYSVQYKKYQEHRDNRSDSEYKPSQCSYQLNHANISKFKFKYTGDMSTLSPDTKARSFPIEWSIGDKTVLEENGFSKDLFNALSREEHINKPLLTNQNIFIQKKGLDNELIAPKKYKNKFADKITDFNPSTDTLEIDTNSFGIDSSATFAAGNNKKAVKKKLAKQDFDFLYDQKKGGLYFNENGSDKGFGNSGLIAILKGAPNLTASNLDFI